MSGIDQKVVPFLEIDFQLAYLVALTLHGVKPLSRWEKGLDQEHVGLIEDAGLSVRRITRSVRSGKRLKEIVFSLSEEMVTAYYSEFDGTPIDRSPPIQRKEGLFLGYPECCTNHFIDKPYGRNSLDPEDQKILFHWACPGCVRTEDLLPKYREVHERLNQLEIVRRHNITGDPPPVNDHN